MTSWRRPGHGAGAAGGAGWGDLCRTIEQAQVKSGSAVLTMLEKATVPYAGARVEVTCPTESSAATGSSVCSSALVSRATCRVGTHSSAPLGERVGSGMYSGSMHRVPIARCEQASAHGCGQLFKHCLLHRPKTTLRVHHRNTLIAIRELLGRLNSSSSLLRRLCGATSTSIRPTGVTTDLSTTAVVPALVATEASSTDSSSGCLRRGFGAAVAVASSAAVLVTQRHSQSTPNVRAIPPGRLQNDCAHCAHVLRASALLERC